MKPIPSKQPSSTSLSKSKGIPSSPYIIANITTASSSSPMTSELGEQSRRMLNKLIPLIQLCQDPKVKSASKAVHKKSLSISQAQSLIASAKKSSNAKEQPSSAAKCLPNTTVQVENIEHRKTQQKHNRTRSDMVKPKPCPGIEEDYKSSQNKPSGLIQKDSSTSVYHHYYEVKKEDSNKMLKYSAVVSTTPTSPVKGSSASKETSEKANAHLIAKKSSPVPARKSSTAATSHKRSSSDTSMIDKLGQPKNDSAKAQMIYYKKAMAPTCSNYQKRPVSSSGNALTSGKKNISAIGILKKTAHHEKSVSNQYLLNSFGKYNNKEEFKGKSLLEEFRKSGCIIKNPIKSNTNVTTSAAVSVRKEYSTNREKENSTKVIIKPAAKSPIKVPVSMPHSTLQSAVHSPSHANSIKVTAKLVSKEKEAARINAKKYSTAAPRVPIVVPLSSENLNKLGHQKDLERLVSNITSYFKEHKDAPPTTTEFYRIGRLLGKGAFGKVNLGMHKLTGKMVAIKSISKKYLTDETSKKKVMQEFSILKLMRHSSIIRLYETFESKKHILFIIELCAGGDLLNYVRKRRKLKETIAKSVFQQLIDGLIYCHSKGILHRDIKLDNVLLNAVGDLKICDFGVSKSLKKGEKAFEQCGTPAYIAPEILLGKGYEGYAVDIWSAGVALYAMLYGTVPFKGSDMKALQRLIISGQYTLKENISSDARDLLKHMLEVDPNKRISENDILSHPWLQKTQGKISLFSEEEKEAIKKEYSYVKQTKNGTDTGTLFTEQNIDSTQNDLTKNITSKSVILGPFNSSQTHIETEAEAAPMMEKGKGIRFSAKVRDADRQYEKNNNGDMDNGVYNKFADDGAKGKTESVDNNDSIEGSFEGADEGVVHPYSGLMEDDKTGSTQALTTMARGNVEKEHEKKEDRIDEEIVKKMESLGYPRGYIMNCLNEGKMNYATATYYLLLNNI